MSEAWHVVVPGRCDNPFATVPNDGVVVCVNLAMRAASRCDYWCCYDTPNELHRIALDGARRLECDLITERSRAMEWIKLFSSWPAVEQPAVIIVEWDEPSWLKPVLRGPPYSIFHAFFWAIQQGAKRIDVHGCTMESSGYFDSDANQLEAVRRQTPHRWASRWQRERAMFSCAQEAALMHGIEIHRVPVSVSPADATP